MFALFVLTVLRRPVGQPLAGRVVRIRTEWVSGRLNRLVMEGGCLYLVRQLDQHGCSLRSMLS